MANSGYWVTIDFEHFFSYIFIMFSFFINVETIAGRFIVTILFLSTIRKKGMQVKQNKIYVILEKKKELVSASI